MNTSTPSFLKPLTMQAFFEEYWEQQPLFISRTAPHFSTLIDISAIESLLSSQPLYFPGVQLTQSGRALSASSYTDEQNRILPLRLLELHQGGATIVLSQAQVLFPPLNELCREVMRTLKMRCQTNVYVSPPGNQGFNAHYDTHDVFILQVSGTKTFNFYPSSLVLPFAEEQFDPDTLVPADIDESIALSAGDTLYIPRGVVHDAVADAAEPSIHVTLGVYPVTMRDVLQEAVQLVAQRTPALRKSIDSFQIASCDESAQALPDHAARMMEEVVSAIREPEFVQQITAKFSDELSVSALQNCDGVSLRQAGVFSDIKILPDSRLRLRQEMLIDYQCEANGVKIRSFGQIVEFSEPFSDSVLQLLSTGELPVRELDRLSEDQRDALVARLLQENLIKIE